MIHSYIGPAPVFDARTICVRPNITNIEIVFEDLDEPGVITGNISIPTDLQHVLEANTPFANFEENAFGCEMSRALWPDSHIGETRSQVINEPLQWHVSICEYWVSRTNFSMKSEFENTHSSWNNTLLLLNSTGIGRQPHGPNLSDSLAEAFSLNDKNFGYGFYERNEWLDVKQDTKILNASAPILHLSDMKLSFSLCFPIFDGRFQNVSMTSPAPLHEPTYLYDTRESRFSFDLVRSQLLRLSGRSNAGRGVLSLEPQHWSDTGVKRQRYPFGSPDAMGKLEGMLSPLDDAETDRLAYLDMGIRGLGLEILSMGGTNAEAVQSMLTGVFLADYQRYVFPEVEKALNGSEASLRSDFVLAQVPGGNSRVAETSAGATRSFVLVMFVTALHSATVALILVLFVKGTYIMPCYSLR